MSSPPSEPSSYDRYRVAEVDELQRRFPAWFILWLPYTRRIGAWHMADPDRCRYVSDATAEGLSALMCEAELEFCPAWTLPAGRTGQGQARQAPSRGHEAPRPSPPGVRAEGSQALVAMGTTPRVPYPRVGDAA